MSSVTISQLDTDLAQRLCERASLHGISVEEEARAILREALKPIGSPKANLAESIRARLAPLGGIDLPEPVSEPMRDPVDFGR